MFIVAFEQDLIKPRVGKDPAKTILIERLSGLSVEEPVQVLEKRNGNN